MNPLFSAEETSQMYLLVIGLTTGSGIIALIVKFLLATPERESTAYKKGVSDEHTHNVDELKELKAKVFEQDKEIINLRNGMLRLAVATDLTAAQKREIANILGFKSTSQMLNTETIEPEQ